MYALDVHCVHATTNVLAQLGSGCNKTHFSHQSSERNLNGCSSLTYTQPYCTHACVTCVMLCDQATVLFTLPVCDPLCYVHVTPYVVCARNILLPVYIYNNIVRMKVYST